MSTSPPSELGLKGLENFFNILHLKGEEPLSLIEARRVLKRSKEVSLDMFDLQILPETDVLENESVRSRLQIDNFFWEEIKRGKISRDAAKIQGVILLVDRTARPDYVSGGMQMYNKDPLGPMLAEMREKEKITIPNYYKGVNQNSRFAISLDNIFQNVCPEIARRLEVKTGTVRPLTMLEYILLSDLYYSWKGLNTYEWTADKYEGDKNLTIGNSTEKSGTIGYHKSNSQALTIGFRVAIAFPLNPR